MSEFPLLLRVFLTEECAVKKARHLLQESRVTTAETIQRLRAEHTPVDFLLALAKRPVPKVLQLEEQRQELARNQSADELLEFIEQRLAEEIEDGVEKFLREADDHYTRGIARLEHIEDWKRAVDRFRERFRAYLREVGQARNAVSANYDHARRDVSPAAQKALFRAALAGSRLQEEAIFVNKIATLHEELVRGTPTAQAVLPRVQEGDYSGWIHNLKTLPLAPMQIEFDRILALCEDTSERGITELEQQAEQILARREELSRSYVLSYIEQLREHAAQHWFKPEEMDPIIARLEKRYKTASTLPYSFGGN